MQRPDVRDTWRVPDAGRSHAVSRPVIVQHSAGAPGANGPLTAVQRVLTSSLAERYEFVRMHQSAGNGV